MRRAVDRYSRSETPPAEPANTPEIARHLVRAALAKLCDPANYLGQASIMVDRVLARTKRHVETLPELAEAKGATSALGRCR
jgi:hypothetical protein